MIFTRKFLNEYVDLKNISNEDIEQALNDSGFEVERVFSFDTLNTNIVIGKVLSKVKLANFDKLSYCMVDINEELPIPVVCGANNVEENRFVIFAKIGAHLANGMIIEERMIANKPSLGMICSLQELGIPKEVLANQDAVGVYLFPEDVNYPLGNTNPLSYIFENDTAFVINLTYNRSDCLSAYELAREIAAFFKLPLKSLITDDFSHLGNLVNDKLSLDIKIDNNLVKAMKNVTVLIDSSVVTPKWLFSRLCYANIRPNNLIQDLLNYVSWETGQPLVGYDFSKINSEISIQKAMAETKVNDQEISLQDFVIASDDIIEVLGVMTNKKYEIINATKQFVVLALHLNEKQMYEQKKRYLSLLNANNLLRWSKPSNGHNLEIAIQRFLELLTSIVAIKQVSPIINNKVLAIKNVTIKTSLKIQKSILGISDLTKKDIIEFLKPLGFLISESGINDDLVITVPKYRLDIMNEADISEEIARRYGYNNIPNIMPLFIPLTKEKNWSKYILETIISYLLNQNIFETKTYNLESSINLNRFNFFNVTKPVKVLQPMSLNHQYLRTNLVNSLLTIAQYNNFRKINDIKIYSYEDIYDDLKFHHQQLSILLQGKWMDIPYLSQAITVDFINTKGLLKGILRKLNFNDQDIQYVPSTYDDLHPHLQANVVIKNQQIAIIGKVHPKIQQELDFKDDNFIISLNMTLINELFKGDIKYQTIIRNMFSWFDLSLLVNKDTNYDSIIKPLLNISNRLVDLQLINEYENVDKLGQDKKSWTLRLFFNDARKQLTDEDLKEQYDLFLKAMKDLKVMVR